MITNATRLKLALVVVCVRLEVIVNAHASSVRLLNFLTLGFVLLLLLLSLSCQLCSLRASYVTLHRVRARRAIALDARHRH